MKITELARWKLGRPPEEVRCHAVTGAKPCEPPLAATMGLLKSSALDVRLAKGEAAGGWKPRTL